MEDFDFMEQLLNPFAVNRLAEVYTNDEEYQNQLKKEDIIYQKLSKELKDEQAEELKQYFMATSATAMRREALAYKQGMKDLFALLKTLSKN